LACQNADAILNLVGNLSTYGSDVNSAADALENLVAIRERLDDQGTGIEVARQRVEGLIGVKDLAISQTRDLADATENLELMSDVQDQLAKTAVTFGRMRNWITEILTFEPTFNRAMKSLQPLVELGNIRHLSAADLRQVIRTMNEREPSQLTASPEAETSAAVEAAMSAVAPVSPGRAD
jgi:hypothetical protein